MNQIPKQKQIRELTNYFRNDLNGLLDIVSYLDNFHKGWRGTCLKYFQPLFKLEEENKRQISA